MLLPPSRPIREGSRRFSLLRLLPLCSYITGFLNQNAFTGCSPNLYATCNDLCPFCTGLVQHTAAVVCREHCILTKYSVCLNAKFQLCLVVSVSSPQLLFLFLLCLSFKFLMFVCSMFPGLFLKRPVCLPVVSSYDCRILNSELSDAEPLPEML